MSTDREPLTPEERALEGWTVDLYRDGELLSSTLTDAAGVYRFSGLPGAYPIRARIRRQANLPYETGHSKRVTVHVR